MLDKPLDKPLTEKIGQLTSETEREDLRIALVAGQESAAVQILLEACLETEEDRKTPGQMWSLREIRSVVCSYLHQVFIADPSLAKLVHFQVCCDNKLHNKCFNNINLYIIATTILYFFSFLFN